MLILQAVQCHPPHGYAIAKFIRNKSGDVLSVETGSVSGSAPTGTGEMGQIKVEAN